ncbi:MAG: hypothetical protein IJ719_08270 [Clostridia bacterium]|nr:hypothetical protein [Clostridia bacterium]
MDSCIHCMGLKRDSMDQLMVQCEYSMNWTLAHGGSCFGDCDAQEYSAEYIATRLETLRDNAYDYNIGGEVIGIPVYEFERLMNVAVEMLRRSGERSNGR